MAVYTVESMFGNRNVLNKFKTIKIRSVDISIEDSWKSCLIVLAYLGWHASGDEIHICPRSEIFFCNDRHRHSESFVYIMICGWYTDVHFRWCRESHSAAAILSGY